ncbi:DEKNAAC104913 [Brettanomyces naardenensis]|uniref:Peptide:N-glycanase 1 n=1 Tax=Brettanomyces naardenensis TaxID=13370 RepID=A0A448YSF3_BRENA|nr:DEKNAAC104913 [Brettanomyces naardenensis]
MTTISELAGQLKKRYSTVRRQSINSLLSTLGKDNNLRKLMTDDAFAKKITSLLSLMKVYQDPSSQSEALDIILASPVYSRLDEEESKTNNDDYTDRLVKQLLKWFKEEFFTWVNKPDCPKCGNTDQNTIQQVTPWRPYKKEHFEGNAGVIERYRCEVCNHTIEFPRYNNPSTLLKTRSGRCGEWDNCFILLLKSLGLKVRYLWNMEDHVWCEYYSTNLDRWVHLDCCENSFDNPLLYNRGWAKKMSYIFAISDYYIRDVTDKYIDKDLERTIPRDKMSEDNLAKLLALLDLSMLSKIQDPDLLLEVSSDLIHDYRTMKGTSAKLSSSRTQEIMIPRQSGSVQWTSQRGENGH